MPVYPKFKACADLLQKQAGGFILHMDQLAAVGALQMQMLMAMMLHELIIIPMGAVGFKATDLPFLRKAGQKAIYGAFSGSILRIFLMQGRC